MNKILMILIIAILISLVVIGCAGNSKANSIITGTLYVSGNEPFTHLALKTTHDEYYKIECSDSLKKELWQLQGKVVDLNFTENEKLNDVNTIIVSEYKLNK